MTYEADLNTESQKYKIFLEKENNIGRWVLKKYNFSFLNYHCMVFFWKKECQ